jgi:hypothetical protein
VKANLPAAVCFLALLYCCWELYRSKQITVLQEDRVVITVHGPDGSIIEPVGPAGMPLPPPAPQASQRAH